MTRQCTITSSTSSHHRQRQRQRHIAVCDDARGAHVTSLIRYQMRIRHECALRYPSIIFPILMSVPARLSRVDGRMGKEVRGRRRRRRNISDEQANAGWLVGRSTRRLGCSRIDKVERASEWRSRCRLLPWLPNRRPPTVVQCVGHRVRY